MNDETRRLNFMELLHYEGVIDPNNAPFSCKGYCISCERKGVVPKSGELFQMSHAAHTDDFVKAIGEPFPVKYSDPIMFLLESPGGNYGNGSELKFQGFNKYPPTNHYYWVPTSLDGWPNQPVKDYGPYFAYLMNHFGLGNVYITNLIKCSFREGKKNFIPLNKSNGDHIRVINNCVNSYLSKEFEFVRPRVVLIFGTRTYHTFKSQKGLETNGAYIKKLLHPSAFNIKSQEFGKRNDKMIQYALEEVF